MFDPPVTTTGTIIRSPKPNIYFVSLPNGKEIIGHIPKALQHLHADLEAGVKVTLELTPFDFEKGRISGLAEAE
ncbi:hypothetical protein JIN77_02910 [Verrucomicrobiaceae bacterium R5-34]|uniref:S1-like domain-containing protein n=1 Tax=Oceaniferula flava TaxID=2800421 RepID=A0AAE2SAI7_9BACT|nr:hypothetical protein [Oceaniferula flavus]MBK1829662.1 hypothetical protein [Verrucomicrobiaceae bacterium R5-34]MBK1853852.1 hypothetical protein [Oceaniferula flavus]MBM1135158.1 hypothetical protein [Oceaniferula flavus]